MVMLWICVGWPSLYGGKGSFPLPLTSRATSNVSACNLNQHIDLESALMGEYKLASSKRSIGLRSIHDGQPRCEDLPIDDHKVRSFTQERKQSNYGISDPHIAKPFYGADTERRWGRRREKCLARGGGDGCHLSSFR